MVLQIKNPKKVGRQTLKVDMEYLEITGHRTAVAKSHLLIGYAPRSCAASAEGADPETQHI